MSKLINSTKLKISDSESIIGFETTGSGDWKIWDRYLTIDGKKAYHIGNICGTCAFFFERLEGANKSISPNEVSNELKQGLDSIDEELITKISKIIPNEEYYANLLEIAPSIVNIGEEGDYFQNEQVDVWGIDGFWGFPHHPKIRYYRGTTCEIAQNKMLYEFIVPMFPQGWLDEDTVSEFKTLINSGSKSTALAISVLDIKEHYDSVIEHWCLTHYLVDGHHKTFAASSLNKPLTILSFLAINQGVSNIEDVNFLLDKLTQI